MNIIIWTNPNMDSFNIPFQEDYPEYDSYFKKIKKIKKNIISQKYFYFMDLNTFINEIKLSIENDAFENKKIENFVHYESSFDHYNYGYYKTVYLADLWYNQFNKDNFKQNLENCLNQEKSLLNIIDPKYKFVEMHHYFKNLSYKILKYSEFLNLINGSLIYLKSIVDELQIKEYKYVNCNDNFINNSFLKQ